jgi:hypothetical protein
MYPYLSISVQFPQRSLQLQWPAASSWIVGLLLETECIRTIPSVAGWSRGTCKLGLQFTSGRPARFPYTEHNSCFL